MFLRKCYIMSIFDTTIVKANLYYYCSMKQTKSLIGPLSSFADHLFMYVKNSLNSNLKLVVSIHYFGCHPVSKVSIHLYHKPSDASCHN